MKKKTFKCAICIILSAIISFSSGPIRASATTYMGTLSYWHSGGSLISMWDENDFYIGIIDCTVYSPSFSSFFSTGVFNACSEWDDALSVNVSATTNQNISTFNIYGGSKTEIQGRTNDFSEFDLDNPIICGATKYLIEYYWCTFKYYPSGYYYVDKIANKLDSVSSCVVDRTYENGTQNKIIHNCLHEIGHAFGWRDHSSASDDAMYSYVTTITSLSDEDIEHLHQIYTSGWY